MEQFLQFQKNPKNKNPLIWYLLIGLFIITIIFSLYNILIWHTDNIKINHLNKDIVKELEQNESDDNTILVNPPDNKNSNYYNYVKFPLYEVNFADFLEQNKDTVAFIKLKNTIINYPVVKYSDNKYYLNHSFDKKKNNAGWIFMDYRNNESSDNIIIYGHSRLDGTLFGTLKKVLESTWQEDMNNYVIYFSTPKENRLYLIFSIYTIDSETYYITPDFISKTDKQKWIDTMVARNTSKIKTEVDVNDKFLTLSTCQNHHGGRIVVHAKLIKKQITE